MIPLKIDSAASIGNHEICWLPLVSGGGSALNFNVLFLNHTLLTIRSCAKEITLHQPVGSKIFNVY